MKGRDTNQRDGGEVLDEGREKGKEGRDIKGRKKAFLKDEKGKG